MFARYPLAEIGSLLGDPSRVAILTMLLDGHRHPAGELAATALLSPQAASAHLARLCAGGLVSAVRVGRHRLFELVRPEVGEALEALAAVTNAGHACARSSPSDTPLRFARTCYDHLAGRVAVGVAQKLVARGVLRPSVNGYDVSPVGERWFADLEIDLSAVRRQGRKFTRQCPDWTEREPHLGGALGAALLRRCLSAGWVKNLPGTRAVRITDRGTRALREVIGLDVSMFRSHS